MHTDLVQWKLDCFSSGLETALSCQLLQALPQRCGTIPTVAGSHQSFKSSYHVLSHGTLITVTGYTAISSTAEQMASATLLPVFSPFLTCRHQSPPPQQCLTLASCSVPHQELCLQAPSWWCKNQEIMWTFLKVDITFCNLYNFLLPENRFGENLSIYNS